jgi:hypothetical protein
MVTSLEVEREKFWLDLGPGLLHFAFRRMDIVLRGQSFKVVTYPYLEPRLRVRGVTLPFQRTYSWRACGQEYKTS